MPSTCADPKFYTDEKKRVRGPICPKKKIKKDNKHTPSVVTGSHKFAPAIEADNNANKYRKMLESDRKTRQKGKKKINWRE